MATTSAEERKEFKHHDSVKDTVRQEIKEEVNDEAAQFDSAEKARIKGVVEELKAEALKETVETEKEVVKEKKVRYLNRVIDYGFSVLYGIIGLMIVLELLGARESAGFKQFLNTVSAPFLIPFKGLMPDPAIGSFQLMISYIIALCVYALIHYMVKNLLALLHRRG